ncbi:MAG: HlyD family secretion protein [Verrucomicrobiota bacterium]|jgi:HlyD family secretion protein
MANSSNFRWVKWLVILVVIGGVIAAGVWYLKGKKDSAPQYQSIAIARGDLTQAVTATGQLNPVKNVTVGSQISGIILKLYADFNSPVKAGEVVAELDPATYKASVAQAEGELANARANMELMKIEADRATELLNNKLISKSDYDKAQALFHQAEAQMKIRDGALQKANVDLSRCTIVAPVDGIVISRNVDVGQTVAASLSAPTLFVIANDLTKMQIDANVSEADVGGVEPEQEVAFTVDAFPYRTFHGEVVQVRNSPTTVQNVVTYDAVISVDNPDMKLKPGMTANVSVIIAERPNALKIPNSALRFRPPEIAETKSNPVANTNAVSNPATAADTRRPGGGGGEGGRRGGREGGRRSPGERQSQRTVYLLTGNGKEAKLKPAQIKVGISDSINTEVLEGLSEGDQVVTGLQQTEAQAASAARANPFGGPPGMGGGMRR